MLVGVASAVIAGVVLVGVASAVIAGVVLVGVVLVDESVAELAILGGNTNGAFNNFSCFMG